MPPPDLARRLLRSCRRVPLRLRRWWRAGWFARVPVESWGERLAHWFAPRDQSYRPRRPVWLQLERLEMRWLMNGNLVEYSATSPNSGICDGPDGNAYF